MSVHRVEASHYRVVCEACRRDAVVCPRRRAAIDVFERAVQAFLRAGWHRDAPRLRQPKQQKVADEMGEGRWYCPTCSAGRP